MDDLTKAKQTLACGNYTAVICKGEKLYTSTQRGVKPLVMWVEEKQVFCGYSAADKVVGKATAFLYALLGVRAVYAQVISKPARKVLAEQNITVEYDTLVDNIINRQGNGICPFEEKVLNITDANDAYIAIRDQMQQLNITL